MKASLKGKCEYDTAKPGAASAATAASTFAVPAGADLKLRASMTDATFLNGPSLQGLTLTLEKPGSFLFDFNVPKQDFRFQFMNSVRVLEKPLNLTYIHNRNDNRTVLEGTLLFDPANKVTANHTLGSKNGKLKYTYVHQGITTFEPCYDLGKDAWDFAVSRRFQGSHVVRASYQTANQMLGLEWLTNSKSTGNLKISATLNLAEEVKVPKIMAESTFNFEM